VSYTLTDADGRPQESDEKGQWGGHRGAKIYGRLDCPSALRALARGGYARQRVFFADEATAIAAGYRSCATCRRERYDAWCAGRASWLPPSASTRGLTWLGRRSSVTAELRPPVVGLRCVSTKKPRIGLESGRWRA
jgi:hypothetical protein